jgi:hypothetical protein
MHPYKKKEEIQKWERYNQVNKTPREVRSLQSKYVSHLFSVSHAMLGFEFVPFKGLNIRYQIQLQRNHDVIATESWTSHCRVSLFGRVQYIIIGRAGWYLAKSGNHCWRFQDLLTDSPIDRNTLTARIPQKHANQRGS